MIYTSKGPIKTSHEGLMIGNGALGALIYGETQLFLSLDRIDLWDNRLPKEYRHKDFNYAHLIDVLENNYQDYGTLFGKAYGHSYPTKINTGMLVFDYKVQEDDIFSLDVDNATFSIKGKNIDFDGFIDANKNVMVYRYNKELNYSIKMADYLTRKISKRGLAYKPFIITKEGNITHVYQHMYGKHCFGIIIHENIIKNKKQLLVSVYKDDEFETVKQTVLEYSKNVESNEIEHKKWWSEYYGTADIKTKDPEINKLFTFGRYYFGCNSRKDYPMTLHGVWTRNNGELPPWKADLHNDINVQMTYEAYMKLGNYEEGKVLTDWMINHRSVFRRFAKNFMNSKGLLVPGGATQEGRELGGWPQYSMNPSCSIWVIKAFYDYYCYTKDIKFLRKEAYPFFVETEQCVFDWMELNKEGKYQLKVMHASPEYFENEPRSIHPYQTNFELIMLRYLYIRLIEMGKILKKDVTHYEDVLSKLSDYYRDEEGLLVISKDQKFDMSHRHFSHMLMYKNMELVDPFKYKDVIQKDLSHLESFGPKCWVGFSPVECSGLNSYIRNGEQALKHLKDYECFTHPNGFHMNTDYKRTGYTWFGPYVLTLEANIGYIRSLSDMMIQNYEDKLVVFPAVAEKMKQEGVEFTNLRTFGDHKVSGKYENNKETFIINLKKKDTITLFNNIKDNPTLIVDGKPHRFNTKLNEFIVIKAKNSIELQ